jgi:hypothetical protein
MRYFDIFIVVANGPQANGGDAGAREDGVPAV